MNKALRAADRWAPGVISLVTLLAVLTYILSQERVNGRLEGRILGLQRELDARVQLESALRSEVQVWQAYVVDLRGRMIQAGISNPPPPQPVEVNRAGPRPKITTRR